MEDVFEIQSGHDIYQRERTVGETPYITSTAEQNGIGYFVGNINETLESNCISVNRNGSIGYAFYHPYEALYGNDTRKLIPHVRNKYVCIFLTKTIISQKDKYGYGLKMGTARLRRQKIMLPVNESGNPDYSYMENYMKAIEHKLLLNYIEKRLINLFSEDYDNPKVISRHGRADGADDERGKNSSFELLPHHNMRFVSNIL